MQGISHGQNAKGVAGASYSIGVDIGGTFTDSCVIDNRGTVAYGKAPSTPGNFSVGVMESLRDASRMLKKPLQQMLEETALFVHSCTVATNAIINASGAMTGLLTTKGFEDTLLIMRAWGRVAGLSEREATRFARTNKPAPIVPRHRIKGVRERIDHRGTVLAPLSTEDVVRAVEELVEDGVDSIAVCLLWSFVNPAHEQRVRDIVREMRPDMRVSLSSDLSPLMGEYERTATAAMNAYLSPVASGYFGDLEASLRENGLRKPPLIMQAYGGSIPISKARDQAVTTIGAGPTAGILAAQYLAEALGHKRVISADVGGTSFDVGLIYDGRPEMTPTAIVNQYVVLTPRIEVESVGAGGGSIAWLERVTGQLRVGPNSAGAVPGPACYGSGGTEPTVTDANVVLGYLNPDNFLNGRIKLSKAKAFEAIERKIAKPLQITPEAAASAIYDIVNVHMAGLIRRMTVERGYDPRTCVLFGVGGGGGLHVGTCAEELGIKEVIVPVTSAVHCAMGAALSDVVHTYAVSKRLALQDALQTANDCLADLERRAQGDLRKDGFQDEDIALRRQIGMSYDLQIHDLMVDAPPGKISEEQMLQLRRDFEKAYERSFGQGAGQRSARVVVTTLRVEGIGKIAKPEIRRMPVGTADSSNALKEKREVYFGCLSRFVETPIFDMEKLLPGNLLNGPALVETPATTILIHPGQKARVDGYRNVIIETCSDNRD